MINKIPENDSYSLLTVIRESKMRFKVEYGYIDRYARNHLDNYAV